MLDVIGEIETPDNVRVVKKLQPYCCKTTHKQRHQTGGVDALLRMCLKGSTANSGCRRDGGKKKVQSPAINYHKVK